MIPALLLAAALAAPVPASAPADTGRARSCILVGSDTQYYPADDHTIAIRSGRRWYKLIVSPSARLTYPQSFLINDIRGTSTLCSALDFDLSVSETGAGGGFREGLIAQSFAEIPAEEGEALRKKSRR